MIPELNKIYTGDCVEIMKSWPDGFVDMIWTDPPYGHANHDGDLNSRLNDYRGLENKPIKNDGGSQFREIFSGMLKEAQRILKKDAACCCCCCGGGGPSPTFAWVANQMDAGGLEFFHSVIWDKVNPGLGWRFRRQHEMIMVAKPRGGKLLWADNNFALTNVIKVSKPREGNHPNEKPLELVSKFIQAHTIHGQVILDPFCGSGTTLVAAESLGRKWIGIEIEPKYVAIAEQRIAQERAQGKLF